MDVTEATASTGTELYTEVLDWLYLEAELLDSYRERAWLEGMVSRDIVYQVPLRQTVERSRGFGFSETTFHLDERYGSLESRVARNETQFAWAEDPPSRIRHFVTNARVRELSDGTVDVRTNLLVYRTRQDQTNPQLLGGERHDELAREDGRLMLRRRQVLLDLTVIGTHNLSIFF
jgi:ethylbenzene dioxygenase beta subunit